MGARLIAMGTSWRRAPAVLRLMLVIVAVVLLGLLAGCAASGVKMSDEEAQACAQQGCTVWTEDELQGLAIRAFREGFARGLQQRRGGGSL